jgi:EAL domain-containing protein (putative c-di-GMP-specific phosphodiesterase class I)/AmiR/NasT family two-component response regulator
MEQKTTHSAATRAIVVDDDAIARRLAIGVLRSLGVAPDLEAADGVEALARIRNEAAPIDIALCDLEMDGMDGVEFLTQLGAERPGMAVVLLSGMEKSLIESVEGMAKSSGLRVLGALQKPLDRDKLSGLIARLNASRAVRTPVGDQGAQISIEEIRVALLEKQFVPFFQPKIDLRTGELVGAEALVRWQHPQLGLVPPNRFIPLAEDSGQIIDLTWLMLDSSMRTLGDWLPNGLDISVSVNITVGFLEELAVTENIIAMAQGQKVPSHRIVLEITESTATTNVVTVIGNLARLRMRGFGLAIDDFGTGYASMQQLSRIPFNELKVDRSFVSGAARYPNLRTILESSLDLGRRLGLQTTAEGIETEDELSLLRGIGCDTAQGFLFAKPMEATAFWKWKEEWQRERRQALFAESSAVAG